LIGVLSLIISVLLFVVGCSVFPHSVEDFEPSLCEASQSGVVGFALGPFALVEVACPAAGGRNSSVIDSGATRSLAVRQPAPSSTNTTCTSLPAYSANASLVLRTS